MDKPTKENTLYLPIKQVYFDEIIAGTKKAEYREVKDGVTANRYLLKENGTFVLNPESVADLRDVTADDYYIDDYNGGKFPFMPKPYRYLSLAVGYSKERDTALVEVVGFSFEPNMIRYDREGNPFSCFWTIVFHLGRVVEVHRKPRK